MVFSGVTFLFYFLPLFLLLYFLTPDKHRNKTLLLGSIFFYQWGVPWFVFVILTSTLVDFHLVKRLHASVDQTKRKKWLILSLVLNLGLLAWFKYANFFVANVQSLQRNMGIEPMAWVEVLLPIGISFYTFQTITYAVDVYRRKHEPLQKAVDYLMYILMFPQLIAGPIVRFHEIADSINARTHTWQKAEWGIVRFAIGLSKKVLIANVLGQTADEVFRMDASIPEFTTATAWIGLLAYTFQIYFDFSGYSDMAIGLGLILGFRFPENFDNPYKAGSISEFWRRWHITLGNFMKNYLYIPMGGNRNGLSRTYFNLILVFALSGLWHGASWTFVAWGLFHGIFLLLDRMFLLRVLNKLGAGVSVALTFLISMCGWVLFRSETISDAQVYYSTLFKFEGMHSLYAYDKELVLTLVLASIFSWCTCSTQGKRISEFFFKDLPDQRPRFPVRITALSLLILSFIWLVAGDFNPFIYFRF
ncbi:MAG: MBOAT family protein [Flavobacteriales bacterium]|nr:MBOAT family protein [Flavobacteriales bacterium]